MPSYSENDEIPLPLVRRHVPTVHFGTAEDDDSSHPARGFATLEDRLTPSTAGGIVGLFAGAAMLGVVHAMEPAALYRPIAAVATARGVDIAVSFGAAYATAAAIGALVGATFAVVTRYLRKWGPLLLWALVFFVSLAMLLLAASSTYGRGIGTALAGPILAASAVFGLIVSFSLPIRRRR